MSTTADPSCECAINRTFRAPRDLVLKMYSDPNQITKWWGPIGLSTTTHAMNFSPSGEWKFTMHSADGNDFPAIIKYISTGPDCIEYDHLDGEGGHWFHVVINLSESAPGKTDVFFRVIFRTAEERNQGDGECSIDKDLNGSMDRLDTLLAETQAAQHPFRLHSCLPSDTEIRFIRSFRAPRKLVFEAFTKPEHLKVWQAPYHLTMKELDSDQKPGGKWHMSMTDSGGNQYRFYGDIIEVVPPERFVGTFEFAGMPGHIQTTATTFEETDGITKVTINMSYASKADRDGIIASGMEWGAAQCYDQLETLVMSLDPEPLYERFTITRTFDAPKDLVWKAWTEADRLAQWWGPKGCKIIVEKFDFQPGGSFHYSMNWEGREPMWGRFVYRNIQPTDYLVFVNSFSNPEGEIVQPSFIPDWPAEILNKMTLTEANGQTTIHLEGGPLSSSKVELEKFVSFFDSMRGGFAGTFDNLAEYLKSEG